MSRDYSRELTRKSTRGTFVLHLARLLRLRDERLLGAYVDQCRDSVTSKRQFSPKESREWRVELWKSAWGMGRVK